MAAIKNVSVHPRDVTRILRLAQSMASVEEMDDQSKAEVAEIVRIAKRLNATRTRRDKPRKKAVAKKAPAKKKRR